MFKRLALTVAFSALAAAPAFALVIPPGGYPIVIDDGSAAGLPSSIGPGHRVYHMVAGKKVFAPPGTVKLKTGGVFTIGPDDKVVDVEALTLGSNTGGGNAKPVGGAKITH